MSAMKTFVEAAATARRLLAVPLNEVVLHGDIQNRIFGLNAQAAGVARICCRPATQVQLDAAATSVGRPGARCGA